MIVLGMDTCGAEGSLAVVKLPDLQVVEQVTLPGRRFAGALVPAVRDMLGRQSLAFEDLEAIVVMHGPGSFTGIRVGLSAAKAWSEAAGVPLVAVSRLQVLAASQGSPHAALDAGRGEVYFSAGTEEWLITLEEARQRSDDGDVTVCEQAVSTALPEARLVAPPGAVAAVTYAMPRLLARDFDDAAALDANYVRPLAYVQSPA